MCKSKIACCWSGWIRLRFSLIFIDISSFRDWSGNATKSIQSLKCVGFMCKLDSAHWEFVFNQRYFSLVLHYFSCHFVQKSDFRKNSVFSLVFIVYFELWSFSLGTGVKVQKNVAPGRNGSSKFQFSFFGRVEKSLDVSQKQGSSPSISA